MFPLSILKTKLTRSPPHLHDLNHLLKRETSNAFPKYHCWQCGEQWTETSTKLRESPFVVGALANIFGFKTMPKTTGTGVTYFYFNISVGNI